MLLVNIPVLEESAVYDPILRANPPPTEATTAAAAATDASSTTGVDANGPGRSTSVPTTTDLDFPSVTLDAVDEAVSTGSAAVAVSTSVALASWYFFA